MTMERHMNNCASSIYAIIFMRWKELWGNITLINLNNINLALNGAFYKCSINYQYNISYDEFSVFEHIMILT